MRLTPVSPHETITLQDSDARTGEQTEKAELEKQLRKLTSRLDELQTALNAESKRAVLVVLQGRDTSGKDGTIRSVFGPLNPQGVTVTSFRAPTAVELAHDFLWRVHQAVPPKGSIGIFNRSHYEDVLIVRVHQLVPEAVWRPRYEQINRFESILWENGLTILKFFLHISREEQRQRLLARLEDPAKYWKFRAEDLSERQRWGGYTEAYQEVLARTSTPHAPWYVVPADRKSVRNVLVGQVVVEALEHMDPKYPEAPAGIEEFKKALERS
jgi:PPK2 family polyphosphate:nucleotide phosphotransferase